MDKKDFDDIWRLLKSKKTNLAEVGNVWNLISKLENDDFVFDENEVIEYVTSNKWYDLKYTNNPDFNTIIEDCMDMKIVSYERSD